MAGRADWLEPKRRDAWHFGRGIAADLTEKYRLQYKLASAPPPATIIYELLTDFLDVRLSFDPLPPDRFAQTAWVGGRAHVTINSLTDRMQGVGDAEGVMQVAAWHEAIHVVRDGDAVRSDLQRILPGMDEPVPLICYRDKGKQQYDSIKAREFHAEEAGRAAAVSVAFVVNSEHWRMLRLVAARSPHGELEQPWPRLYSLARDLGVNITALRKQLQYEGLLIIDDRSSGTGKARVFIPPRLWPDDKDGS